VSSRTLPFLSPQETTTGREPGVEAGLLARIFVHIPDAFFFFLCGNLVLFKKIYIEILGIKNFKNASSAWHHDFWRNG